MGRIENKEHREEQRVAFKDENYYLGTLAYSYRYIIRDNSLTLRQEKKIVAQKR